MSVVEEQSLAALATALEPTSTLASTAPPAPDSSQGLELSSILMKSQSSASDEQSSETSWSDYSSDGLRISSHSKKNGDAVTITARSRNLEEYLSDAFSENILAKAIRTSHGNLQKNVTFTGPQLIPIGFPETVYKDGPMAGRYEYREPDFWTCGYFPGLLWALRERLVRYPHHRGIGKYGNTHDKDFQTQANIRHLLYGELAHSCAVWTETLHAMAARTDTHDLGFIIMPAIRREWELTANPRSLDTIIHAAHSLASRYIASAGVIRSWDLLLKKEIQVTETSKNAIIIIDSLCNLDLLYYAAGHGGAAEAELATIATTHARSLMRTHLRPELATTRSKKGYRGQLYSSCHVVNVDPQNGDIKWRWTAQGYANDSTWSRGQAWGVLGYAQTYQSTKDPIFLETACGLAEYFLFRLETAPECCKVTVTDETTGVVKTIGRYVPLWDFDAPTNNPESPPPRDSSAGLIAANGMVILSQALAAKGDHPLSQRFLEASLSILRDTLDLSLAGEKARFVTVPGDLARLDVEDVLLGKTFDAVLKHGTANNNEHARRRLADHGLVYGDYYLVELGNRLLQMGIL